MKESTKVHSVPGTSLLYTSSYQISYICFGPSGTSQVQWLIVSKNHKDTKPKHSFCQKKKKKKKMVQLSWYNTHLHRNHMSTYLIIILINWQIKTYQKSPCRSTSSVFIWQCQRVCTCACESLVNDWVPYKNTCTTLPLPFNLTFFCFAEFKIGKCLSAST